MIGDNIRKALENKGITSNELAKRINVSVPYISYLLNNKRNASIETLEKIAKVLNVNVSDFFEDESKRANSLFERVAKQLNELNRLYKNNPSEDLEIKIEGMNELLNILKGMVESYNKLTFISYTDEKAKAVLEKNKHALDNAEELYSLLREDISVLINNARAIEDASVAYASDNVHDLDEYMEAIVNALRNASPNKKAKILKMIELFDDEN